MNQEDLKKFREARVESLKKNWLVVVGLAWLKPGENSVGSASTSVVALPKSAPEKFARITLKDGKSEILFEKIEGVTLDGLSVSAGKRYPLRSDKDAQKASVVSWGSIKFFLIDRPHGIGVRIKDSESEALRQFRGLDWWEGVAEFRVVGRWQKFSSPRKVMIPDVLGDASAELLEGNVTFSIKGVSYELYPTRKGNELFFVFKDLTTGKGSYGTGRFLDAEVASDGSVVLDFNKAYNPPCAYISYATCPIAPAENKLSVAIEAGEKKPPGHH